MSLNDRKARCEVGEEVEETIWKFMLTRIDNEIMMPKGAVVLHAGNREDEPDKICIWARVMPDQPLEDRFFSIILTGFPICADVIAYIGTVTIGRMVHHVFETNVTQ